MHWQQHKFAFILDNFDNLFLDEEIMILSHNFFIMLSLSCHLPEDWQHGGSCVAVLCSSVPQIYSLLVHLYSGVAQSTACAVPPAMFDYEYCILIMKCIDLVLKH